ncbi:hypothetical protein SAMN02800692_0236 [Luteibacter sp. UNC138MFCol5.1]|nr:hypothetical protein [Luteibacter sp. 3190]SEO32460.1 hypothetical protein SAMN02800692_0236 [Luteibacter sp. UNC138MFCol5.1]
MERILDLQRLEADMGQADETATNYSSCSNRGCSAANADGFEE